MSSPSTLSEYEQSRARNIEKNNARLRALGLISAAEERLSTDSAWGRSPIERSKDDDANEVPFSSDEEYCDEEDCVSSKRKKMDKTALPPREGSRKSRRILNLPTEHGDSIINGNNSEEGATEKSERVHQERAALVAECRDARQRAANEVEKAGVMMAGKDNPTATNEHCLMRVRSMTEKGLINRIRMIERAAGKHCVVKMAIFKSCLQEEDMWELAKFASDALERLKGTLPPPSD
eukprot:g9941.t1 g9941   contig4:918199-918991(+)